MTSHVALIVLLTGRGGLTLIHALELSTQTGLAKRRRRGSTARPAPPFVVLTGHELRPVRN